MKTNHLIQMTLVFIITEVNAQTGNGINADFELNSFDNWTGKTGDCCPVIMNLTGIVEGRHTIMSGSATDPLSLGLIPYLPADGGNYTARLGNSNTGAEAEQLLYSLTVTEETSLFIYRYAVVLEDPGHSPADQPRFSIRVFDQAGNAIPCGTYNVIASGSIPGFINNGNYRIKPWTTVGIQLSDYIGETVTIEFTTADCALGGHFGYAYLECSVSPFEISSVTCPGGDNITTLEAPPGFAAYLWTNGSTATSVTIPNPEVQTIYTCTVTSVTGCTLTLSKLLQPMLFHAAFNATRIIATKVSFTDSSYVIAGPRIIEWKWDFGDGSVSSLPNNIHEYERGGVYPVQLVVMNESGCLDSVSNETATEYVSYFPNAFSPNGDGKNDFFTGSVTNVNDFRMVIFNRYGQLLFETESPWGRWNGSFKNHRAPEGTYVYKVNMTDIFNKTHLLAGTVNLVR
ncbi:MAG TPA: gliding motility-associated C-terminal domain-containing protein [Bacteroidia bacterium]|nr:gliding motility-associated C-terminal domain-containing protein [Bacteroidia bacterium]